MKQCALCGRKGTRRFGPFAGTGALVCTSQRACDQRRATWVRGFTPRRRTHTREVRA